MDIIVTTPRREMANAAQEAADCIRTGGGEYFRAFRRGRHPRLTLPGDRVYYVEDGYIRGFAVVCRVTSIARQGLTCDTTCRTWPPGVYVFVTASSWRWIRPIPMRGFRGYRYVRETRYRGSGQTEEILLPDGWWDLEVVGKWLDPKPETP